MSTQDRHDDNGPSRESRKPGLSFTLLIAVVALVGLGALAVNAYGGSDSSSTSGSAVKSDKDMSDKDVSGEDRPGFKEFRECMRRQGVEVSPDGPPAESEKTDKMREAFKKCSQHVPDHVRKGGADGDCPHGEGRRGDDGGAAFEGGGPPTSAL